MGYGTAEHYSLSCHKWKLSTSPATIVSTFTHSHIHSSTLSCLKAPLLNCECTALHCTALQPGEEHEEREYYCLWVYSLLTRRTSTYLHIHVPNNKHYTDTSTVLRPRPASHIRRPSPPPFLGAPLCQQNLSVIEQC